MNTLTIIKKNKSYFLVEAEKYDYNYFDYLPLRSFCSSNIKLIAADKFNIISDNITL